MRFESELEARVKRLDPFSVAVYGTYILQQVRNGRRRYEHAPPHAVAKMIEAACAYHRKHYCETMTERQYRKIHNLFASRADDLQRHALVVKEDLGLWGMLAYMEQMPLQYRPTWTDMARLAAWYLDPEVVRVASPAFEAVSGLRLDWFLSYGILLHSEAVFHDEPYIPVDRGTLIHGGVIEPGLVKRWLRMMAWSTEEIGAEYRRRREMIEKPYLRSLARRVLLDRPCVLSWELGMFVTPFPELIIQRLLQLPLDVLADSGPSIRGAFSTAFARHVGRWSSYLAEETGGVCTDVDAAPPEDPSEPRCDFIIRGNSYDLFVECKSSYRLPNIPLPGPIASSGLAGTLRDALEQLHASCCRHRRDGVPAYGMIVIPSELPFPNSETFLGSTLEQHPRYSVLIGEFARTPWIISASEYEFLVGVAVERRMDLAELFECYAERPYGEVGEWGTYLESVVADAELAKPPFIEELAQSAMEGARALVV